MSFFVLVALTCFIFDVDSDQDVNIYLDDTIFVMILLYRLLSSHLSYIVKD
jgi:hypothetical protein